MPDQDRQATPGANGEPRHNLFFAAIPPPEISARMAEVWQSLGTGERFREPTLHLSIHAVAAGHELDPLLVQRAQQAAATLRTAPFDLYLDRLRRFEASHALVIATGKPSRSLSEIAADLHFACQARGITASRSRKPNPHVTLAYGPGFAGIRMLETPIRWRIEEITLIDSIFGESRHVEYGRWRLPTDREQEGFGF